MAHQQRTLLRTMLALCAAFACVQCAHANQRWGSINTFLKNAVFEGMCTRESKCITKRSNWPESVQAIEVVGQRIGDVVSEGTFEIYDLVCRKAQLSLGSSDITVDFVGPQVVANGGGEQSVQVLSGALQLQQRLLVSPQHFLSAL